MSVAKQGDTVRVHYIGKLKDGEIFDSSRQGDPLQLTLGENQVIDGFERAIEGMSPGQSKSIEILTADAYGERDASRIIQVSREQLPDEINANVDVGLELQLEQEDGTFVQAIVADLSDKTIILDANHPLAGSDLTFELELVEIV